MEDIQNGNGTQQPVTQQKVVNNAGVQAIDYEKIQNIIDGRNAKTEASILKDYFGKQGLSEEEVKIAIDTFKKNKESKAQEQNQQIANALNENATLKAQLKDYMIKDVARDIASDLGVETKTIPYLLKLADLSNVFDEKGNVNNESVKTSLTNVLDELPVLKASNTENKGFVKVGGASSDDTPKGNALEELESIMGIKPTK